MLGIARVDEEHRKTKRVEEFKDRDPIDAGRFHNDRVNTALYKPVYQPMQINREGTEAAYRFRRAICIHRSHVHGSPDVNRGRVRMDHRHRATNPVCRFVAAHANPPIRGKGWAALLNNFLNGIATGVTNLTCAKTHGPCFFGG